MNDNIDATTLALQLLTSLLQESYTLGNVIAQARDEGRFVSAAELDTLLNGQRAARADLVAAITAAKADASRRG